MTGAGEPPTPGMSNRMTGRRGSSSSTNGWSSSRLAPIPLHNSNGVQPAAPSRTETRRARPPTVRTRIRSLGPARRSRRRTRPTPDPVRSSPDDPGRDSSAVIDIGPWGIADWRQSGTPQLLGRGLLFSAALGPPVRVVRPPGSGAGLREVQPLLGVFRALFGYLVPGLLVARWVDHRRDV